MDMTRTGDVAVPGKSRPRLRTFGVEEEFLLVHPVSGHPVPVAEQALAKLVRPPVSGAGPDLTLELKQEQIEAVGPVCSSLQELDEGIRKGRELADDAAQSVGARAVALATSPVQTVPTLVQQPRYLNMASRFGLTVREQLTCGFHVHVQIASGEEGVGVLDRIRVWLPILLALSANSPFWQGADSGYASFRYQAWSRWPTAGPCGTFGSERQYRRHIQSLLASGVLVDEGMVYFDARLSRSHPTVEVRIADVCMDASHAGTIAGVVRRGWSTASPPAQYALPGNGGDTGAAQAHRACTGGKCRFGTCDSRGRQYLGIRYRRPVAARNVYAHGGCRSSGIGGRRTHPR